MLPRSSSRPLLALVALTGAAVLAGCAPTISVPVAPDATDPRCATIVLDAPDTVAGLRQVPASSQATTAWGSEGAAITLRCGVAQPGPSDQCESVENPDGTSIDWVASQDADGWTFVTYGRTPAVEVAVPASLRLAQPTAALVDVAPAVDDVRATKTCS